MSIDQNGPPLVPSRRRATSRLSDDAVVMSVISSFQSEADAIRDAPTPAGARATVLAIGVMLVVAIVIMSFVKFDRIVTSTAGKIVPTQQVTVFQTLDLSIIKSINAREGDEVAAGQLLATLDPTFASADVTQLVQQVGSLDAQIARDEAQLANRPWTPTIPPGGDAGGYLGVQKAYYDQQVAQYKAQIASFDSKIASTRSTITKFRDDSGVYKDRVDIAQKIEDMRAILADHGHGSQLNLLISQDAKLEVARTELFDRNSFDEAQHTLASLVADRDAFVRQWSTQLSQDLVTARNALDTARSQLDKANRHKELVKLTAPEPSVVLTLAKVSIGSVLKEGDTLFTLMPADTPVAAEVSISPRDIGFVRAGDRCLLKLDTFNYMEHGTAEGSVQWISDNAFTMSDDGQPIDPYYKARCRIDRMNFINTPAKMRLIPGMTLQADLKVGTRSVAMYLLGGLLRGVNEAMREP